MDFILQNQKEFEQGGAICITLLSSISMTKFLFENYKLLAKTTLDYKQFIKNPGTAKYVLLKNLSCPSSPHLFKEHMKFIDREIIGSTKQFSIKRRADNFKVFIDSNTQKYQINCDCSTFNPYVSSPLLINNYDLLKKIGKKPKLTMIACGFLSYSSSQKQFRFYGESFGTTTQQIDWTWRKVFQKNMFLLFFYGIFWGLGIRLSYEHIDTVYDYFEVNKQQN